MKYTYEELAKMIDHSLLHPTMTDQELEDGCKLAAKYGVASVCIKPYAVKRAVELLKGTGVRVGCVIGFPHGNSATEAKHYETELACKDGAVEIDMVINIGKALTGDWDYVERDIKAVCDEAHKRGAKVKVIFENDYLTKGGAGLSSDDFKRKLCQLCERAGADWVKTSTGYGFVKGPDGKYSYKGATADDLKLMRAACSPKVQVKAAGGVRDLDGLIKVHDLGATRCGTTATAVILDELQARLKLPTADDFDDLFHHFTRSLLDFRRQCRAKIEIATADAEKNGSRLAAMECFAQRQHIRRRHVMCNGVALEVRRYDSALDWFRRFGNRGVHEDDGVETADGFRRFDFKLLAGLQFHSGQLQRGQLFDDEPADAVVAAALVAVTDDEGLHEFLHTLVGRDVPIAPWLGRCSHERRAGDSAPYLKFDLLIALQSLQHRPAGVHQLNVHRHLAHGVGGAAQAGIVAADERLDAIEHAFLEFLRLDVFPRNGLHTAVHRQVVVAGGNNQVGLLNPAIGIHPVMMDQRAARGFNHAHAFPIGRLGSAPERRCW